ncbi:MAG: hypothetical protein KAT70_02195, partial [Thermoplasmata archaeon]|nr:hypothetical protein [Thermoplasmata archaeon]
MVIAWPVPVMMGCIVLQALLVWYVLSRNPRGKINRAFALLTISLILWQISYSFQLQCMWTATGTCQLGFNDPIPFWERMRYFGLTFVGPATLYLVILSFVEFKIEKLQALQALLLALPVTVVFALVFSFLTQSNILYPHPELVNGTYQTGQGLLYHYNRMFSYTFLAAALLISFFRVFRPGYKLQRKQAFLFFVAIMVPLSASLDVSLGLGVYPLEFEFTPILFLVTAVLYGIGITQYKLFLMGPARETRSEEIHGPELCGL